MYNNEKKCKLCNSKRYANLNLCFKHYKEKEKIKREEKDKKKKERKEGTKKYQESLRKKTHRATWRLMSEWIRRKDANLDGLVECYTCGRWKHYKEMNAGHYKHDKLDFDERNLKVQCVHCNQHNSGRLDVYAERLIRENGLKWLNQLIKDAWSYNGYSVDEMVKIQKDLKNKISNL